MINSRKPLENGRRMKLKLLAASLLLLSHGINARPVSSGDVMGRDMDILGAGRIGHLALATGDGVFQPTNLTIEAEPSLDHAIVFGTVEGFKTKTRYWGSRYGLITDRTLMYAALVEAKHQSFWCPAYNPSIIHWRGAGWFDAVQRPHPTKCGQFRCDTFVAYVMAAGGANQIENNLLKLPYNAYMTFPYDNGKGLAEDKITIPEQSNDDKAFLSLTPEKLNKLTYIDAASLVDKMPEETTPARLEKEWQLIESKELNRDWKILLISRKSAFDAPETVGKLINLYKSESDLKVKAAIISATMFYYQQHWESIGASSDFENLKSFYEASIKSKPSKDISSSIVRGFIDFHNEIEINEHIDFIEKHLAKVDKQPLIGLQFELIRKSPSLQKRFLPQSISVLKKTNNPELDSMFFYFLNHGIEIVKDESLRKTIKNFIIERRQAYSALGFLDSTNAKNAQGGSQSVDAYYAQSSQDDINGLLETLK